MLADSLLNSYSTLATLARLVGVPPLRLRSRRTLQLAEKYARTRAADGFSCRWREGAMRVVVHVRRGDRVWVEHPKGETLFVMHRGMWTALNLGRPSERSRPLDGTISLAEALPSVVDAPRWL